MLITNLVMHFPIYAMVYMLVAKVFISINFYIQDVLGAILGIFPNILVIN